MTWALGRLMVVLALLISLVATPAHAEGQLELSWDGQRWSDRLHGSLFDEHLRWVPGDSRTSSFHVRNQAEDGATLDIALTGTEDPDRLLRDAVITLSVRVDRGSWIPLDRTERGFRISESVFPAGAEARVEVRADFDPAAANHSQRDEVAFAFRVTLSQDATPDSGDPEPPGQGDEGNSGLPGTGAPQLGWLLLTAALAIGIGLALLRRRGREGSDGQAR